MKHHTLVACALVALSAPALAQHIGPSVLDLQTSFHVGIYSATINVPNGDYMLLAQHGTMDFASGGTMTGGLDTWESTPTGTVFTPNDPLAGDYYVAPDGIIEFDFDPSNPGNDVIEFVIDTEGSAMHVARYELEPEALSVLALEKSSGQTNALLTGTYHFYGQRMELVGTNGIETTAERGTAVSVGNGTLTFTGTEFFVANNGTTSTSSITGGAPYSVAPDGGLTLSGSPGAVSSNGDVFFVITGSSSSSEVGMMIGVRFNTNFDLNDLEGLYSVHGQSHQLTGGPSFPRTVTDLGELSLAAATPTTGSWAIAGQTVDGNASGQFLGPMTGAGTNMTLASNGVLTIVDPAGDVELAFSGNGRFAVGRVIENHTNLFFAMRACPENTDYGTATAGTGGIEPELGMRTFPTLGNSAWRFAVTVGLGGAPAILGIGFLPSPVGIPFSGGLLWLDPLSVVASPFVLLGGAPGVAGAGSVDVPIAIPGHPSFGGVQLFAQAFVLDPAAPGNAAMSRGFQVVFCR